MTPDERLKLQTWEILQNIQEEILLTEEGQPVKYYITNIVGTGIISRDRRIKILYKLEELKILEIQRNAKEEKIGTDDTYYLIIKPLFKYFYKEFEKSFFPEPRQDTSHAQVYNSSRTDLDDKYKKLIEEINTPDNLSEQYFALLNEINNPSLKSLQYNKTGRSKTEIKDIIKIRKIKGKEKIFLRALSKKRPVSAKELINKTGTKNLKSLKFSVKKKLNGTNWRIQSPSRGGWGNELSYQLEFLTS